MKQGAEAAHAKALVAERGIASVRLAVVAFNSIVYGLLIHPGGNPPLAWAIVAAANAYSLMVVIWPPRFSNALRASLWTAALDGVLVVTWLNATGGASSPFYLLWALSLVAMAFRFGPRATQMTTGAYVGLDALVLAADGALVATPMVAVRLGYLVLLGALLSFMSASNVEVLGREMDLARTLRRLKQSERDLDAVLDNAPSIIARVNVDGSVVFSNRGLTVVGDLARTDDRDLVAAALNVVIEEGVHHVVEHRGPGGGLFETRISPILQGTVPIGAIVLAVDVTQQKQQEQLAAAARDKDVELVRLQERDAFRRSFLNAAAHELNTPLTPLRLQVKALRSRFDDSRPLDLLDRNITRLARLVGDLVDVARVDGGRSALKPETHDLASLLDEAAHTFQDQALERGVTILRSYEGPCHVHGDPVRMSQVVYNILSNAVKYAQTKVEIKLEWRGPLVVCAVKDDGPGLTQEQITRMFKPFEQVHDAGTQQAGTGLGLFIARSIMDAHKGDLDVLSDGPGQGAEFRFSWRALPPAS